MLYLCFPLPDLNRWLPSPGGGLLFRKATITLKKILLPETTFSFLIKDKPILKNDEHFKKR
jgi:hypothetical protein